jgi:hypothetical protein
MIEHDRFSVWHSFVKSGGGRSTSRSDAPPVNTRLLNVDRQGERIETRSGISFSSHSGDSSSESETQDRAGSL